jgi:type IV secretory pathway VirJ component
MGRLTDMPGREIWYRWRNRLFVSLVALGLSFAFAAHAVDGDRFGEIRVLTPPGAERGMVMMFSDAAGWSDADQAAATALAQAGAIVAGIDSRYYAERLNEVAEACHVFIGDVDGLSRQLQRLHGSQGYHSPILFGVGEGGAIAAANVRQALANTVAGAVALDTRLDVITERPPCQDGLTKIAEKMVPDAGPRSLPGFWTAAFHPGSATAARQFLTGWAASGSPVNVAEVADGASEVDVAMALVAPHLRAIQSGAPGDELAALPLVELPAAAPTDRMAIILSGDGGWRDIDKTLAEALQARGVSVLGWDCLRYFWYAKTPDEVARALATVLRVYGARWGARHVVLIGYSFGAGVLPFAFNRLPTDLRDRVSLMSLLGFTQSADFEINITGWLGAPPTDAALPVATEVKQLPAGLVQCFYGADEHDSYCPELEGHGIDTIRMPGGHHFDGDYSGLADKILAGFARRTQ